MIKGGGKLNGGETGDLETGEKGVFEDVRAIRWIIGWEELEWWEGFMGSDRMGKEGAWAALLGWEMGSGE